MRRASSADLEMTRSSNTRAVMRRTIAVEKLPLIFERDEVTVCRRFGSRHQKRHPPTKLFHAGLFAALLHQFCHDSGPTCLVGRTDAAAMVAVEVLMEEHQIHPVRI